MGRGQPGAHFDRISDTSWCISLVGGQSLAAGPPPKGLGPVPDTPRGSTLTIDTASAATIDFYRDQNRQIVKAQPGEQLLGPFRNLPGVWKGSGTGWNMIALPFKPEPGSPLDYRLLL